MSVVSCGLLAFIKSGLVRKAQAHANIMFKRGKWVAMDIELIGNLTTVHKN